MKLPVPDPPGLLEAIERLPQLADIIWSTNFKSFWLLHVDLLLQLAIEIGMRNVHRAKLKILQSSNGKDDVNGGISDCWSEGLLEIKARALRIALCNQSRLVAIQGAISIVLDLHEPSGANGALPRR